MGNMAPADCATPALVVGSNLLRWARVYRTANFSVGGPAVRERLLFLLDDIIMPLFSAGGNVEGCRSLPPCRLH